MSVKIEMNEELEAKVDAVIKDIREKQDAGKIELYNQEMKDMIEKHGETALLAAGCGIVKSSWKGYIILPEEYIEERDIPALKLKVARVLSNE